MKQSTFSITRMFPLIMLFFLITFDAGFYSCYVLEGRIRLIGISVPVAILVLTRFAQAFFSAEFFKKVKKTFPIFLFSVLFPVIYGRSNIKQMIIFVLPWVVGYIFTLFVSYDEFKSLFLSLIDFLAIASLIIFMVNFLFPEFIEEFPVVIRNNSVYNNVILSIINNDTRLSRNYGIFWEPGTFSIYLCISLYISLFQEKFNITRVLLLVVTILTTLSTMGISCMVGLFLVYLTISNTKTTRRIKFLVVFAGVVLVVVGLFFGTEFLMNVFGKLDLSRLDISVSTIDRINAVVYPFKFFIGSPILGVGYSSYLMMSERFCHGIATCTFLNWLCLYGIVGGIVPVWGCIRFFMSGNYRFITKCGLFVFALLIFSTENYITMLFIFLLIFYGIQIPRNKKPLKKFI